MLSESSSILLDLRTVERGVRSLFFHVSMAAGSLLLALAGLLLFTVPAKGSGFAVRQVPDYERTLEKVVLTLPAKESELVYHEDLLEKFPGYSSFLVFVAEGNLKEFKEKIAGKPYADRVKIMPYPVRYLEEARFFIRVNADPVDIGVHRNKPWPQGTVWARDAFVACRDASGNPAALVPTYQRHVVLPLVEAGEQARIEFDNDYLLEMRRLNVRMKKSVPLVFAGGNVLFDRVDGKSVAFIGVDDMRATLALSRKIGAELDEQGARNLFREFFSVDSVVVLGAGKQPQTMFHLDQSMVVLPGKRVAVVRTVGELPEDGAQMEQLEEAGIFLHHLRARLKRMGYGIADLLVSKDAVVNGRFPNPVVFTNKESGRMGVFLSAYRDGTELDISLLHRNLKKIRAAGYDADVIWTDASRDEGGVHCLFNGL